MPGMDSTARGDRPGPWLTRAEGARYLHCRRETFERLCGAGFVHVRHLPLAAAGVTGGRTPGLVDARELDALLMADPPEDEDAYARAMVLRDRIRREYEATRGAER